MQTMTGQFCGTISQFLTFVAHYHPSLTGGSGVPSCPPPQKKNDHPLQKLKEKKLNLKRSHGNGDTIGIGLLYARFFSLKKKYQMQNLNLAQHR